MPAGKSGTAVFKFLRSWFWNTFWPTDTKRDPPSVCENMMMAVPMATSLLGMSFLRRLESFEVRGSQLILRSRG